MFWCVTNKSGVHWSQTSSTSSRFSKCDITVMLFICDWMFPFICLVNCSHFSKQRELTMLNAYLQLQIFFLKKKYFMAPASLVLIHTKVIYYSNYSLAVIFWGKLCLLYECSRVCDWLLNFYRSIPKRPSVWLLFQRGVILDEMRTLNIFFLKLCVCLFQPQLILWSVFSSRVLNQLWTRRCWF